MPTKRPWRPFIVPEKFLESSWNKSAPILRLPTEVLVEIFDHAGPVEQFALALACKHLLQVSTFVSLKTARLVGRRVSYSSSMMEELLRLVTPLTAAGRPKKAWHICLECLQYRPTRKSYWEKKIPFGLTSSIWKNRVASWNIICPSLPPPLHNTFQTNPHGLNVTFVTKVVFNPNPAKVTNIDGGVSVDKIHSQGQLFDFHRVIQPGKADLDFGCV